jgi:dipeptide/tripeptide permease
MSDPTEAREAPQPKAPFPRNFFVANGIELFERWAFYGLYVVLSLHLTSVVGLDDIESGQVMGLYSLFRLGPLIGGVIADRIGFKNALAGSLLVYAAGYAVLGFAHDVTLASVSMVLIGLAGALFKPIITGTVVRTSPPGRQTEGFAIFYRTVNAGSVIGKSLTYGIRTLGNLAFVVWNSVVGSLVGLALAVLVFVEPEAKAEEPGRPKTTVREVLRGVGRALIDVRFSGALLILTGFYFMSEQFYQTFPKYITRHVAPDAPLEWVTLLNPLTIAIFQGVVTANTKKLTPLVAMVLACFVGAGSMFLMGALPGLAGACVSFAVFAFAEMIFAPRFYDYVARFAPAGQEATFMGLTVLPVALGGLVGGFVSGPMIDRYLPAEGPRDPFVIWTSYAALGVLSALLMLAYERAVRPRGEQAG